MRLVFCGTAAFAVPSLEAIAAAHHVAAVVTQPDRPGSRGRPAPRPVADAAAALGLPVLRPERIRAEASVAEVLALRPDAVVVAAYGQIIPTALLDRPRHGGINVHASLLPRWRGAAPVAAAILAGDAVTGVSIMRMDAGLDTGPVYRSQEVPIEADDTTPKLTERLASAGAQLLDSVLHEVEAGRARAMPQDPAAVTSAPRLRREDGDVSWDATTAVELDRRVRALQPWPGVRVTLAGSEVRVVSGAVVVGDDVPAVAGTVRPAPGGALDVATASGVYRIHAVQPAGRNVMDAQAYLRGRR